MGRTVELPSLGYLATVADRLRLDDLEKEDRDFQISMSKIEKNSPAAIPCCLDLVSSSDEDENLKGVYTV